MTVGKRFVKSFILCVLLKRLVQNSSHLKTLKDANKNARGRNTHINQRCATLKQIEVSGRALVPP